MKYNPVKKILILVTILAVPGFLYYLLQDKGKNRYKPLAIYGPKRVAPTFHSVRGKQIPDTIYHELPNFELVDQLAGKVTWERYKGQIVLFHLFYTRGDNPGIVAAAEATAALAKNYEKNPKVRFVGISIDPGYDLPAKLAAHANLHFKNLPKVELLTGDTATVKKLVKEGLLLDALKTTENGREKFTYSNMFVLVDPSHRIRGYYEATNQEALSKLDDEIKVLIAEELRNSHDGR